MVKKILFFTFLFFQILHISAQNLINFSVILDYNLQKIVGQNDFYLAGDFNGWSPKNKDFKFSLNNQHQWFLNLKLPTGIHSFKVTRGSWEKVEGSENGEQINNRTFNIKSDTTIILKIASFSDFFTPTSIKSTRSQHVSIINNVFDIPQLGVKRRIWIYLPANYHQSKLRYPVIYMQDGQNLFDKATAGYGEWGVDELLDSLNQKGIKQSIIVGIDHGGANRLTEYNFFDSTYGKGKGEAYVDFIAETLKPYIDHHYRTLIDAKHTGIAGSSMGALISMSAIAKYPKVFGKAGIFSPSFWIAPKLYDYVNQKQLKKSRVYFIAGEMESEKMVADMKKMYDLLLSKGYPISNFNYSTNPKGQHKEWFWHQEFPAFYKWFIR